MPFGDLAFWAQILYLGALVLVVGMLVWTTSLFVSSRRALRRAPEPGDPDDYLWVFLVPALNEEVTIGDSVRRLLAVECANRVVLVIDDGSSDGTPEVLAGIDDPALEVLRRDPPEARQGKAEALNAGWRHVHDLLRGRLSRWTPDRVAIVVVDADGRIEPGLPAAVSGHLADPRVGGVQALVRIYNRTNLLTWFQDVEFSVYGFLYQLGRTPPGTAGMGGNAQTNRLSALDSIVSAETGGPWQRRLTEDQDVGLRLIEADWHCVQETRTSVDQQGVPRLRGLMRQRTRWAQGNLECLAHLRPALNTQRGFVAGADLAGWILMPLLQGLLGLYVLFTIVFLLFDLGNVRDGITWAEAVVMYLLGFGGVLLGCIARGAQKGLGGVVRGVLLAQVYAIYSWILFPVLARAAARQLTRRRDWAKTAREPVAHGGADSP
jgi:cellulose synthase/poly-beta-1,6-N-acetylglucosamine synthase-like glycosyltransferase